jgi:hypothetical protein
MSTPRYRLTARPLVFVRDTQAGRADLYRPATRLDNGTTLARVDRLQSLRPDGWSDPEFMGAMVFYQAVPFQALTFRLSIS